jgi:ribonuclease P protein component
MINHGKTYFPTEQSASCQNARVPPSHVNEKRPIGAEKAASKGAQATHPDPLLKGEEPLNKGMRLRDSSEFRTVYDHGKRYDGNLMTVFVYPNTLGRHRFGITASRKTASSAVQRNRMKRLLRESFRLSRFQLAELCVHYDWVLNAKRSLLKVKLIAPLQNFQGVVARVADEEPHAIGGEKQQHS